MDLLDFFRLRHSWAKLERLLDQLPRAGRFRCAMADDDEVAEAALEELGDKVERRSPPALEDVDFSASLLMILISRVESLTSLTASANGASYTPQPLPWPVSAMDRAKRRREHRQISALNQEVYEAMARYEEMTRPHPLKG